VAASVVVVGGRMEAILLRLGSNILSAVGAVVLDRWLRRDERKAAADRDRKLDLLLDTLRRDQIRVEEQRDPSGELTGVRLIYVTDYATFSESYEVTKSGDPR
jgi:hypothetical protein